mgnify:CR=1 FL=1
MTEKLSADSLFALFQECPNERSRSKFLRSVYEQNADSSEVVAFLIRVYLTPPQETELEEDWTGPNDWDLQNAFYLSGSVTIDALLKIIPNSSKSECRRLISVLGRLGAHSAPALPMLKQILYRDDLDLQYVVAGALGELSYHIQEAKALLMEVFLDERFQSVEVLWDPLISGFWYEDEEDNRREVRLRDVLDGDKTLLKGRALRFLRSVERLNESDIPHALSLLGTKNVQVRLAACGALVQLDTHSENASEALSAILRESEEYDIVHEVCEYLELLGPRAHVVSQVVVDKLAKHTQTFSEENEHLLSLLVGAAANIQAVEAVPFLCQILDKCRRSEEHSEILSSTVGALYRLSVLNPQARDVFTLTFQQAEEWLFELIVEVMAFSSTSFDEFLRDYQGFVPIFSRRLLSNFEDWWYGELIELARTSSGEIHDFLEAHLDEASAESRLDIFRALGRIKLARSLDLLLRWYDSVDEDGRLAIVSSLAEFGALGKKAAPLLASELESTQEPLLRSVIVRAIGEIAPEKYAELCFLTDDESEDMSVKMAAAIAILESRQSSQLETSMLLAILETADVELSIKVVRALSNRDYDAESIIPVLIPIFSELLERFKQEQKNLQQSFELNDELDWEEHEIEDEGDEDDDDDDFDSYEHEQLGVSLLVALSQMGNQILKWAPDFPERLLECFELDEDYVDELINAAIFAAGRLKLQDKRFLDKYIEYLGSEGSEFSSAAIYALGQLDKLTPRVYKALIECCISGYDMFESESYVIKTFAKFYQETIPLLLEYSEPLNKEGSAYHSVQELMSYIVESCEPPGLEFIAGLVRTSSASQRMLLMESAQYLEERAETFMLKILKESSSAYREEVLAIIVGGEHYGEDTLSYLTQLLQSEKDLSFRKSILEAIGEMYMDTQVVIPVLLELLEERELLPQVVEALGTVEIESELVLPRFIKLLNEDDDELKMSIIKAVADIGQVTDELKAVLLKELQKGSLQVALSAASALGVLEVQHPLILPTFVRGLDSQNEDERENSLFGLSLVREDLSLHLPKLFDIALDESEVMDCRVAALQVVLEAKPVTESTITALLELLSDPTHILRNSLLAGLPQLGRQVTPCIPILFDSLRKDPYANLFEILEIFASSGTAHLQELQAFILECEEEDILTYLFDHVIDLGEVAIPMIIHILCNHPSEEARANLACILERATEYREQLSPILLELFRAGGPTVCIAVGSTLAEWEVELEELLAGFQRLLDSSEDEQIYQILTALAKLGKPALPVLLSVAQNQNLDEYQIEQAIYSIGEMESEAAEAVPVLLDLLEGSIEEVAGAIVDILPRIGGDVDVVLPVYLRMLENTEEDDGWLENILRSIGEFGEKAKDASSTVMRFCFHEYSYVRSVALVTLAQVGVDAPTALPIFLEALQGGEEELRTAAAKALSHMGWDARPALPVLLAHIDSNFTIAQHSEDFYPNFGDESEFEGLRLEVLLALDKIGTLSCEKILLLQEEESSLSPKDSTELEAALTELAEQVPETVRILEEFVPGEFLEEEAEKATETWREFHVLSQKHTIQQWKGEFEDALFD